MKVYNAQEDSTLKKELQGALLAYRQERHFDEAQYVEQKARVLNEYMKQSSLKTCVVAISGGIDSAVVLGLVSRASRAEDSPIGAIIPLFLPVYNNKVATNQNSAYEKAAALCRSYHLELKTLDITGVHQLMKQTVDSAMAMRGEDWAAGQLVAYLRTPAMYYVTSLCAQNNQPAIVCGTTNYDEGGYLGYFGKASDGMVDVQLISDAHKSEVRALARYLGITQSIIDATPTGDMYDGRVDEEVFGTPYDFVELYTHFLNLSDSEQQVFRKKLHHAENERFNMLAERLENLHRYNGHKYMGRSPAVHLDILQSSVKGGWNNERN